MVICHFKPDMSILCRRCSSYISTCTRRSPFQRSLKIKTFFYIFIRIVTAILKTVEQKLYNSFRLINKSHRNDWLNGAPILLDRSLCRRGSHCARSLTVTRPFWSVHNGAHKLNDKEQHRSKNRQKRNVMPPNTKKCHHNNSAINSILSWNYFLLHLIVIFLRGQTKPATTKKKEHINSNNKAVCICVTHSRIFHQKCCTKMTELMFRYQRHYRCRINCSAGRLICW